MSSSSRWLVQWISGQRPHALARRRGANSRWRRLGPRDLVDVELAAALLGSSTFTIYRLMRLRILSRCGEPPVVALEQLARYRERSQQPHRGRPLGGRKNPSSNSQIAKGRGCQLDDPQELDPRICHQDPSPLELVRGGRP